MANQMYGKGRQAFLEGSIAYLSDAMKFVLVNSASYTLVINTDQFLSDIPGGARIATSANLASKTSTLGVANAAGLTISAVTGAQVSYAVMYKDTGTASTSPLIANWDTATGLPLTPNGGDVTLAFDTGANKIFVLFEGLSADGRMGFLIRAGRRARRLLGLARGGRVLPGSRLWVPSPGRILLDPAILGV